MPYVDLEKERARSKERYKDPVYRAKVQAYRKKMHLRFKEAVLELYGRKCAKCGFADVRALQIDHIYSDGAEEKRTKGHGAYTLYKRVLNDPEHYQLLCANCNWIKRIEEKEAPQPVEIVVDTNAVVQ